nr:SCY1-like protein 2 [Leptinotarsa decemlineata]
MDMFNKVFSQVSSSVSITVSQISGVLPGNPVTREYESSAHIASAGPGLLWKIYSGSKRSTKQEASIFVFEKRQLEKYNKSDRELLLETLRRGIVQLTKIRHPKLLTIQHPLEESRDSLAFATEPVLISLANILGQTTNMPQPANISDYKLFDIEIKYGLLQVGDGLAFLHNDMKLLHKNISPECIIISAQGAWKIFGFDFSVHNTSPSNLEPFYPFEEYNPTIPSVCQPNLDYLAPECITKLKHSPASDMFSLGMLAYALYSIEKKCIRPVRDLHQYKSRVQELEKLNLGALQCVPEELRNSVKSLLNVTPEIRLDTYHFLKIPFFDDVGIKTLTYLDSLLQWDNLQKSQFYKGLPEALTKLPHRVKVQRVLACLVHDLGQPAMVPFILPNLFDIAQDCNKQEYCTYILPHIKPLMKLMEPVQILLIMLQRMELLLKLTPAEDIQQHVLPMLYRGLDSGTPQIHELCLAVLPTFAGLLDHSNVKNCLLPRIKKICLNTSTLSVRVNSLLCIGRLLENLDKWLVIDEVLPFLPQIPSREPAVLMGILGIYKLALNHKKLGITKEIIASRVLPFLIPLCIESGLTIPQFNAMTSLVKEMFQIVETEHRTKLEQLNSVKDEQKVLASSIPVVTSKEPVELDKAFSGLGLDSFVPGMNIKQKTEVQAFTNQTVIERVKAIPTTAAVPKNLPFSLGGDWTNSQNTFNPQVPTTVSNTSTTGIGFNQWNNSQMSTQNSFGPNMMQNTNLFMNTIQHPQGSDTNRNPIRTSPGFNNQITSTIYDFPNPWANSQGSSTYKKNNSPDWSALDNLLPSSNSANTPKNSMASYNVPLIPSNNVNNKQGGLSNDDIMDLLS